MNDVGDNPAGLLCMLGVIVAVLALVITIWWQIWAKTGYGGAMSLLMLLPIVNLIMLLVLAFSEWPVLREVRQLRRELADRDDYGGRRSSGNPPMPPERPRGEGDYGYTR